MLKITEFANTITKNSALCEGKLQFLHAAGMRYYAPPVVQDTSEWPEKRKLVVVDKQPNYGHTRPPRMKKMLNLIRGPEEVHTDLLYKGYGVKALLGGRMKYQHFEAIRRILFRRIDPDRMFAIWRVEPPWQPCAKRGVGKRMGGGKGSIHHYVTPVRAERIIVEIGGDIHKLEAKKMLAAAAEILPFPARFVSQESLEKEREENRRLEENNINPYTMEYVIRNNMGGCGNWLSPYDYKWFGKYK
ncbi:hypothetical protein RUM43_005724 [Polyplax serrata]|uniref:Large ribosomal subunit protein uL16m n=1 Tax=Polyplax serrata TaxID=468196 RepID=A0AAN8P9Y5_POLSC